MTQLSQIGTDLGLERSWGADDLKDLSNPYFGFVC